MKLLLAVDIADRITVAAQESDGFNLYAEAGDLLARHPEANISYEEVVEVLAEETKGLRLAAMSVAGERNK